MTTFVRDFYPTTEEFEETLDKARRLSLTSDELQLVFDIQDVYEQFGLDTSLSEDENDRLLKITGEK